MPTPIPTEPFHIVDATMFWSATGGGVRRYLLKKHAWLSQQPGCSHSIAVPLPFAPASPDTWLRSLPAWPVPRSGGYRLPLDRGAVADVLVHMRPSIIEAGDPYRVAWGALDASQRLGVPAVAFCHSNLERVMEMAGGRWLGRVAGAAARRYARHLYGHFDAVLAPSHAMRQHLADWGIDHVAVQPLGVDTEAFAASPMRSLHVGDASPQRGDAEGRAASNVGAAARSRAWRLAHGFRIDQRVLVFAGRFAPEKNLDVLATAVRVLGDPYVLLAIGAGPKPPPSDVHVRTLPFMADVSELVEALSSADAFVHAGDQETFGLSVLEAMACGLPVVARAAEGLAEMVDSRVGVAVQGSTPAAFAEAIAALFANDVKALGVEARRRAEAHDWNAVLPTLLQRYRTLVEAAPRAAVDRDDATLSTREGVAP